MKLIQYFDNEKQERCGSDFLWVPDQRFGIKRLCEIAHKPCNQSVYGNGEKKLAYFRVANVGSIMDQNYHYLTDFIAV